MSNFPLVAPPDVFGFHVNANITKNMKEATQLLDSLLDSSEQEGGKGKGQSMEEVLAGLVKAILSDIVAEFD
jgi:dynein heavy chain